MGSVFFSIVSHNHLAVLKSMNCVGALANKYNVVLKNNVQSESEALKEYCKEHHIHLVDHLYGNGFGANNNIVYSYCCEHLNMGDDDVFIVLNPDVKIDNNSVEQLVSTMFERKIRVASISLYKDADYNTRDYSVRHFPQLYSFVSSFLGFANKTFIRSATDQITTVDWAAGSFLAFNAGHYRKLRGFDERYFMYCEDIDICYRSYKMGYPMQYVPYICAIHLAKHQNRKVFSKHFYWHAKSAFRFLLSKHFNTRIKSTIGNSLSSI
ncbi:glycosyltransferase family 2 protein [Kosakonia sacchari]|uniref:glycosyltransferase family 2 protein n=1 Tax=Kosakonia sacchari TaxID=1158459 RepID=UPI002ACD3073|nr:glycosyltransferase family 2 protein [Kosakonia sacchari]MDZ7320186.1 glycosyltransferase family 2 protein [Kosakonia sacchari]